MLRFRIGNYLAALYMMHVIAPVARAELLLTPASISAQGTISNSANLVIDGLVPGESTVWNGANKAFWSGQTGTSGVVFTIDYGVSVNIENLLASVDNNDAIRFEISDDNIAYSPLTQITIGDGEIFFGMDTMSSDSTNPEYVAGFDFTADTGRYLRLFATGGDGSFSVGEVQAFGSVVPEPTAWGIIAIGLFCNRRHRRRAAA